MTDINPKLVDSFKFYRGRDMSNEESRAASMLRPVPAVLGLSEWKTTAGQVYAKGANAVDVQVGINRRAAAAMAGDTPATNGTGEAGT